MMIDESSTELTDVTSDENRRYESWWDPEQSRCSCLFRNNMEYNSPLSWLLDLDFCKLWQTYKDDIACRSHQYWCQHNQGEIDDVEVPVVDILD